MAKSKARKKTRRTDKRPRIDSTPGVAFSVPPPSAEPSRVTDPPPSFEAAASEPRASDPPESGETGARVEDGETEAEAVARASDAGEIAAAAPVDSIESANEPEPAPVDSIGSAKHKKARDESGEFGTEFFAKSEEEVHLEEARREAPDLHDDELASPVPRRHVHRRAHQIVIGVVGFAALIGLAGAVMRRATPRAVEATAAAAPIESAAPAIAATPEYPPTPTQQPTQTPAPPVESAAPAVESAAPVASAAPVESAAPAPVATVAPPATVASASSASTASAAPAPSADPDDALTAGQALAQARSAIAVNNASRAAALAKKAIAKGAGGSAYYVLGAAYQTMGSNGAAKGAYKACANSGCPEASECASLLEGM